MNRKARDRAVAAEIVAELTKALGPVAPEMLTANSDKVCEIFGAALDRHEIVSEFAAANVMRCIPRLLARRQIDAAMRGKGKSNDHLRRDACAVKDEQHDDCQDAAARRGGRLS
jgi:hypothetical protein